MHCDVCLRSADELYSVEDFLLCGECLRTGRIGEPAALQQAESGSG